MRLPRPNYLRRKGCENVVGALAPSPCTSPGIIGIGNGAGIVKPSLGDPERAAPSTGCGEKLRILVAGRCCAGAMRTEFPAGAEDGLGDLGRQPYDNVLLTTTPCG